MSNVVDHAESRNEFVTLDDGYVYYWPTSGGAISAQQLRELATELDRRNKDWDDHINEYFENKERECGLDESESGVGEGHEGE